MSKRRITYIHIFIRLFAIFANIPCTGIGYAVFGYTILFFNRALYDGTFENFYSRIIIIADRRIPVSNTYKDYFLSKIRL